jgi:hypothetical protein
MHGPRTLSDRIGVRHGAAQFKEHADMIRDSANDELRAASILSRAEPDASAFRLISHGLLARL